MIGEREAELPSQHGNRVKKTLKEAMQSLDVDIRVRTPLSSTLDRSGTGARGVHAGARHAARRAPARGRRTPGEVASRASPTRPARTRRQRRPRCARGAGRARPGSDAGEDAGGGSRTEARVTRSVRAPGVVLCDDFEQSTIDTQTWTKLLQGNDSASTLSLDPNMAKTGKQSLHSTISANAGQAMLSETRTFPMPMNKVYGRVYLNFGSPVIPDPRASSSSRARPIQCLGPVRRAIWKLVHELHIRQEPVGNGCRRIHGHRDGLVVVRPVGVRRNGRQLRRDRRRREARRDRRRPHEVRGSDVQLVPHRNGTYGGGPTTPAYDLWVDDVAIGTAPIDCLP